MISGRLKPVLAIMLLLVIVQFDIYGADTGVRGRNNYYLLQKMFARWESGLFGSRNLYRNRLNRVLIEMIDDEIITGHDYTVSIPEIIEKRHYSSDLYNNNWLHIHGIIDDASLLDFKKKGIDYIKEVERNKYLYSLGGKIDKFRIVELQYERYKCDRSVHLYLKTVRISDSIK